jgi:hypothetical protein
MREKEETGDFPPLCCYKEGGGRGAKKQYKLQKIICNFLLSVVICSLLGSNNVLSILFLNAFSPCSSLNARDQVGHPDKTKEKYNSVYFIFTYLDKS